MSGEISAAVLTVQWPFQEVFNICKLVIERPSIQRRIAGPNAQTVCQGFNFPPPKRLSSGEMIVQVVSSHLACPTIHTGKNAQVVRQR